MGGGGSASRVKVELFFLLLSEDVETAAEAEAAEVAAEPEAPLASSPPTVTARI